MIRVLLYEGPDDWVSQYGKDGDRNLAHKETGPRTFLSGKAKIEELDRLELSEDDGDYQGVLINHRRAHAPKI